MEPLIGIIVGALAMSVPVLLLIAQERERRLAFRQLAYSLGLVHVREERRLAWTKSVEGELGEFGIRVTLVKHQDAPAGVRIVVDGRGCFPQAIDLRLESIGTSIAKRFGRKEIEMGDEIFDAAVFIRGPELALQAALGPRTRWLVCELLQTPGRIADGALHVLLRSTSIADTAKVRAAVVSMIDLAGRLKDPENLLARLRDRFHEEPAPGVRLRLLELLADRFPAEPEARAVFREALLATDDNLRLRAARVLGDEGRGTLIEIATYTDGDNAQAVRAIELLGRRLPIEGALEILNDSLRTGHHTVARAAIQTLGLHGGAAAIDRLAVVLAVGEPLLAAAAAHALADTEDPGVEPRLLAALPTAHPDVALALCHSLGRVGSSAAVAPLRETALAATTDRTVALAARQAIAAIQARLSGASPGQVSLAEGESGDLSLAEPDASGLLSLPREPPPE
jgi:hypothetical protein